MHQIVNRHWFISTIVTRQVVIATIINCEMFIKDKYTIISRKDRN